MINCKECVLQKRACNCQRCKNITKDNMDILLGTLEKINEIISKPHNENKKIAILEKIIKIFNIKLNKFKNITPIELGSLIKKT